MFVEIRRAPHGLAGVIDDEIETFAGGEYVTAKRFNARGVAKIKSEDFQAMPPGLKIGLGAVAHGGVTREAGGYDKLRSGAEEFDARLEADLHSSAGQERDSTLQVREFS